MDLVRGPSEQNSISTKRKRSDERENNSFVSTSAAVDDFRERNIDTHQCQMYPM